ncbi:MAG: RtcB family protein, partial [Candidatus Micrarchaeota archaeon]|nr:RtcB family protein [Candidatus Micrarchaeota archaeon]
MEDSDIKKKLREIEPNIWQLDTDFDERMLVPARLFASRKFIDVLEDGAIRQAANVACLPGIQKFSLAMPDMHYGYGFPIGGVAAFDVNEGIISPGGIGYDINCGVCLMRTDINHDETKAKINDLLNVMYKNVPAGIGSKGRIEKLTEGKMRDALSGGARWAVENGYGWEDDLKKLEENGEMKAARPESALNEKTYKRGAPQLGSLGAGNHFLEVQRVEEIYDEKTAEAFG